MDTQTQAQEKLPKVEVKVYVEKFDEEKKVFTVNARLDVAWLAVEMEKASEFDSVESVVAEVKRSIVKAALEALQKTAEKLAALRAAGATKILHSAISDVFRVYARELGLRVVSGPVAHTMYYTPEEALEEIEYLKKGLMKHL